MKVWRLQTLSWAGFAPGASHHTVTLHAPDQELKIEYLMDEATVARFRNNEWREWAHYEVGEFQNRFFHESEAQRAAVAVFNALADAEDVLIEGERYLSSPGKAYAGNPERVAAINAVNDKFEVFYKDNPFDRHGPPDELYREWDALMSGFEEWTYEIDPERKYAHVKLTEGKWEFIEVSEW